MGRVIGTCSICGGAVTVADPWWGVTPPMPSCSGCGALPVAPFGPLIPMRPASVPPPTIYETYDAFGRLIRRSPRPPSFMVDREFENRPLDFDSTTRGWPRTGLDAGGRQWSSGDYVCGRDGIGGVSSS